MSDVTQTFALQKRALHAFVNLSIMISISITLRTLIFVEIAFRGFRILCKSAKICLLEICHILLPQK